MLPISLATIPPSSERGLAQAVRQSASLLALSIPVGSAWREGFVGRGGGLREGRGDERAARSSVARRSMLGCAAGEGRKEASARRRGGEAPSSSFSYSCAPPSLSLPLALPSSCSENVLPSSDGSAPGAPARLGGVALARGRRTRKSGMKGPLPGILTRPLYPAPHYAATRAASLHLPSLRLHSPGLPRSPHSVLGVIACSIKPDVRRPRARRRPPACVLASRSLSLFFSLSLCLSWVFIHSPHSHPPHDAITARNKRRFVRRKVTGSISDRQKPIADSGKICRKRENTGLYSGGPVTFARNVVR